MAGGEKTEKPTPQRLREARRRGDIASSPELTGALLAVIAVAVLQGQAAHIFSGLLSLLSRDIALAADTRPMSAAALGAQIRSDVSYGLMLLAPLVLPIMVGALAVGVLNTRGLVSFKPLKPSLRKLNPVNGVKHLVSKDGLVLLMKALLKLAVTVLVVNAWSPRWQAMLPGLVGVPMQDAAGQMWSQSLQAGLQITEAFALFGFMDFGYRYYTWYTRQRMSKQEIKEEFKRSEGNPQMRARMRQLGRKRIKALIANNGLRRVPTADVVITNPTHFAVAIQYRAGSMRAPRVIAKGQRLVALRIREAARRHNVPIVENKPLAQALFRTVEVNQEIPADLYQAVAQVLAFVYKLRGTGRPAPRRAAPRAMRGNAL